MKKIVTIVATLVLSINLVACSKQAASTTSTSAVNSGIAGSVSSSSDNAQTLTDETQKVEFETLKIDIPTWAEYEVNTGNEGNDIFTVIFKKGGTEAGMLTIQNINPQGTRGELTAETAALTISGTIENYKSTYETVEQEEVQTTTINGLPGYYTNMKLLDGYNGLVNMYGAMGIFSATDTSAYVFMYASYDNYYDEYLPFFQKIISSITE